MLLKNGVHRQVKRVCVGAVIFCVCIFAVAHIANAATITLERFHNAPPDREVIACEIRIDGPIEDNDKGKLSRLLRFFELTERPVVCLDSSGGSYEEALRIAELIVNRHLSTVVDADADCLSACVIVFLAGNANKDGSAMRPSRRLHAAGKLDFDTSDDEGISTLARFRALYPELISDEFFAAMSTRKIDKLVFIETVSDAIKYSINVLGVQTPREFSEVSSETLCNICDNANPGNGHCAKGSRKIDVEFAAGTPLELSSVTSSFLHYGPEGNQRCTIDMVRASKRMVVRINGAGENAAFQNIFFYSPSTPLASLPLE